MGPRLPARRPRASVPFVSRARPPRAHSRPRPGRRRLRAALPAPALCARAGRSGLSCAPGPSPPPGVPAALPAAEPERSAAAGRAGGANMATVPVYCVCRLPYDVTRFMIECDACKDWFHGR